MKEILSINKNIKVKLNQMMVILRNLKIISICLNIVTDLRLSTEIFLKLLLRILKIQKMILQIILKKQIKVIVFIKHLKNHLTIQIKEKVKKDIEIEINTIKIKNIHENEIFEKKIELKEIDKKIIKNEIKIENENVKKIKIKIKIKTNKILVYILVKNFHKMKSELVEEKKYVNKVEILIQINKVIF